MQLEMTERRAVERERSLVQEREVMLGRERRVRSVVEAREGGRLMGGGYERISARNRRSF